jgi:hypothetical protein
VQIILYIFPIAKNLLKNSDTIDSESGLSPYGVDGVDANNKKTDDHSRKKIY